MVHVVDSAYFRKFLQGEAITNLIDTKLSRFKKVIEDSDGLIDAITGKKDHPRALLMIAKDLVCPIFNDSCTVLRPIYLYDDQGPTVVTDTVGSIIECDADFTEENLKQSIARHNQFLTTTTSAIIGYVMMDE